MTAKEIAPWRWEAVRAADLVHRTLHAWEFTYKLYPDPPRNPWDLGGLLTDFIEKTKADAGFQKWSEAHIVRPLGSIDPQGLDAVNQVSEIAKMLKRLSQCLQDGRAAEALGWEDDIPRDATAEVALRILAAVDKWRLTRGGSIKLVIDGRRLRANPGPFIAAADLARLGGVGPVASGHASALRKWANSEGDEAASEPLEALGFLQSVIQLGAEKAARLWAVNQSANGGQDDGLNNLKTKHPKLLGRPVPLAVLRVLLADPQILWSQSSLAKSDNLRDLLASSKASARTVGRALALLVAAGLAVAEGSGTGKRWRYLPQDAARCRKMPK